MNLRRVPVNLSFSPAGTREYSPADGDVVPVLRYVTAERSAATCNVAACNAHTHPAHDNIQHATCNKATKQQSNKATCNRHHTFDVEPRNMRQSTWFTANATAG